MISTLKNNYLKVNINAHGAELNSIKDITDETEYLWSADENVWNRHAPVLFPIVGMVKENRYMLNGKEYRLTQHGFARDMNFEIINQDTSCITYQLKSNDETLKKYPYKFFLNIKYTLEESTINVEYTVKNADDEDMWFSIGGHPGFACPSKPDENYEDYYIEFEKNETAERIFAEDGLITDKKELALNNSKVIPLSRNLFNNDALIFKNLKSEKVYLKCKNKNHAVEFDFGGFQYLGIWSKPQQNSNFVCLEPWFGIADSKDSTGDFIKKDGIIKLQSGKLFNCSYSIKIIK